ncbi:rod shape-determining protein MreC [Methylomonas methanica]|uniref:Cell shape-determining protein MreC n=1 Tax=Methylomonas methanica TaxID=421 RepID=A0A177MT06_METMH|nr:rod shape-determining protein MreC [Methylomonas methanica]OAI08433.1 rod shape-determining protein MreC [Methylomonas methanica]
MKLLFAKGPSLNTRLLVALLVSISMLVIDYRSERLERLRSLLSVFTYPLQSLASLPVDFYQTVSGTVISFVELQKENRRLKEAQFVNDAKLLKFAALEKENTRLRMLLENSFQLGEQVLVAELVSVKLAPYEHTVVVNKGSRFGVHPEQPVLDANGIVGQVVRALPSSSEVMLITDPDHAIPVQVNRNGLRTIAFGTGQPNRLHLPFLANNADIVPGDLLVTSGLGGVFPAGYPVAVVDKFEARPDKSFANIYATPKAELDKSREFLIVWSHSTPVVLGEPGKAPAEPEPKDAENVAP